MGQKEFKLVIFIMIILGGILPVIGYAGYFWQLPMVDAETAIVLLNDPKNEAVLVDVRNEVEYRAMHVEGSLNYPLEKIELIKSKDDFDESLKDKFLTFICSSEFRSAAAGKKMLSIGVDRFNIVRGGMQNWVKAGAEHTQLEFSRIVVDDKIADLVKPMPLAEQTAAVVSGFGFKPLHMILSLILSLFLLRQKSHDLKSLGYGLLIFFFAEVACAVNYLFFDHESYLAEYLHSFGMVVAFGFSIYAILEGLDTRIIKFSIPNKRCAFLEVCKECAKNTPIQCKARYLFMLGTGMLAILAIFPLLTQPTNASYNTQILGSSYNYCRLLLYQYYESRYLPIVTLVLCGLTFLVFMKKKNEPAPWLARVFVSAALGAWGFSMLRLVFTLVFQNALIWADFWEEITELMFVVSVAAVIWIYRKSLIAS